MSLEQEARRLLAWAADGGNVRQVDSVVLRDMDANEDNPRRVHIIPLGEAIGFAITDDRSAPEDKAIVWVSSHALGASLASLGFTAAVGVGAALVAPRFATPDYKPEPEPEEAREEPA